MRRGGNHPQYLYYSINSVYYEICPALIGLTDSYDLSINKMKKTPSISWQRRVIQKPIGKGGRPLSVADWTTGHAGTILAVMDDGLFRTRKQIQKSTGLSISNAAGTVYRLWEMGGLERRDNPKHDFGLRPWQGQGSCLHLYRITDAGKIRKPV